MHSDPLEVANIVREAFAQVSSMESDFLVVNNRAERLPLRFKTRRNLSYNCEFGMSELEMALHQAHDTIPGPD